MAKAERKIKGVSSVTRKGVQYWYCRLGDQKAYCGKGEEGRKMAEAARAKHLAKRYEQKEIQAGLKVQRPEFRTILDLANWYMMLPQTQAKKSYVRKVSAFGHLIRLIGNKRINLEGDDLERYRETRKQEGAASGTVDNEIIALRAMYLLARKRKKIVADSIPGEFPMVREVNPRRKITEEEFGALLNHADPDFADVLICGFESAMRSSEITSLTAGQVHLNETRLSGGEMVTVDYVDLGIFDTKNKTRRTVPVSAPLKGVLQRRMIGLGPEDYVFRNGYGRK